MHVGSGITDLIKAGRLDEFVVHHGRVDPSGVVATLACQCAYLGRTGTQGLRLSDTKVGGVERFDICEVFKTLLVSK